MEELKAYVYDRITSDPTVQTLLGSNYLSRVFYLQAPDNQKFPYIVHKFLANYSNIAVYEGFWYIDIWDNGPNPSRCDQLRDRIVSLFGRNYSADVENFKAVRFFYESEMPLDELVQDNRIHRIHLTFTFRASSVKDISNIIDSESN